MESKMSIAEPTLAAAVKKIHASGWYTTFMYDHRAAFGASKTGTESMRLFLRHILRQAVKQYAAEIIRERCKLLLAEAKERGCFFSKAHTRLPRHSVTVFFDNGSDVQYSRSIGVEKIFARYDYYPDTMWALNVVESFFLSGPRGV